MIWRMWIGLTVVVVVGAWVWMVPLSPPPTTKTTSAVDDYRDKGLLPKAGALVVSEEVGHDVFEVPPGDAEERARIIAALGRAPVEKKADAEDKAHEIRLDDNAAEEEDHEIRLDDDEEEAGDVTAIGKTNPGGPTTIPQTGQRRRRFAANPSVDLQLACRSPRRDRPRTRSPRGRRQETDVRMDQKPL